MRTFVRVLVYHTLRGAGGGIRMIDNYGREIDYLRISITDRCNLRCIYCMPQGGIVSMRHEEILSFEEMIRLVRIMTGIGLKHLRLTGGEPMARCGCLELAAKLHEQKGIESISMTSNGILLRGRVAEAKQAGISALNLSIDSLDPDTYAKLTRGGALGDVLDTFQEAVSEGMNVKVNSVLVRGENDHEITALAGLARKYPVCVRFIELMPIGNARGMQAVSGDEVIKVLTEAFGQPVPDNERHGYGPAKYYRYPGFSGPVGLIGAVSHEFCGSCNRIRLTSNGQLKLCLNHSKGIDLKSMLREGKGDDEIRDTIRRAILEKPERHGFFEEITDREKRCMNVIGG